MGNEAKHKLVLQTGQWEQVIHAYLACITYMDGQVGRVVDALEASPHARNTLI